MSKLNWLPTDYEAPKGVSGYMKMEEGVNRIRILSAPITGWEIWMDGKNSKRKPLRSRYEEKPEKPSDPNSPLKYFWSFVVWNYAASAIQILHVTQASIRKGIEAVVNDEDWGHPAQYDIKITKRGEGVDTEYVVNPVAPSPLSNEILKAFKEKPIWLEALYDGGDPFQPSELGEITPISIVGGPSVHAAPKASKTASKPAPAPVQELDDEDGVDIELFMDMLPENCLRDEVEEFVDLCAKHVKMSPERYMMGQLENIPTFVTYFNEWAARRKGSPR